MNGLAARAYDISLVKTPAGLLSGIKLLVFRLNAWGPESTYLMADEVPKFFYLFDWLENISRKLSCWDLGVESYPDDMLESFAFIIT